MIQAVFILKSSQKFFEIPLFIGKAHNNPQNPISFAVLFCLIDVQFFVMNDLTAGLTSLLEQVRKVSERLLPLLEKFTNGDSILFLCCFSSVSCSAFTLSSVFWWTFTSVF